MIRAAATLSVAAACLLAGRAQAATLAVCRPLDTANPSLNALLVPGGTLFRDVGRFDDPLAAFNRDHWQLRLETIADMTIPPLEECVLVLVRVTSDSSVKAVSLGDNRKFVYAGSSQMLDPPSPTEELLSLIGRVLDQVP